MGQRVLRERLDNVSIVTGTPDDPRLPSGSFDRIFMVHMYHEIRRPYEFLWRMRPALNAGGQVIVVEADRAVMEHGMPAALLDCEFKAAGYRLVARTPMFYVLFLLAAGALGGYCYLLVQMKNRGGAIRQAPAKRVYVTPVDVADDAPKQDNVIVLRRNVGEEEFHQAAREVLESDRFADAVRERERFYQRQGIHSVPAVIVNDRHLIQGGQPPEVFEQALRQIATEK